MADTDAIVETFADALRTLEPDALIAGLAPGAIVWHNHDRQEVDARRRCEASARSGRSCATWSSRLCAFLRHRTGSSCNSRCAARHREREPVRDAELRRRVIADDKITRIDEYVDRTVAAQLA